MVFKKIISAIGRAITSFCKFIKGLFNNKSKEGPKKQPNQQPQPKTQPALSGNELLKKQFKEQLDRNINATNTLGYTPLMQMVKTDNLEMVKWIIQYYPQTLSIQKKTSGTTVLMHAAKNTNKHSADILNVLLIALSKLPEKEIARICDLKDSSVHNHTFLEYLNLNTLYSRNNASLNDKNIASIKQARNQITKIYFKNNSAAATRTDSAQSWTPLMFMVFQGDLEMVTWMMKNHPESLFAQDCRGATPLMIADSKKHFDDHVDRYSILMVMLKTLFTFDQERIFAHSQCKLPQSSFFIHLPMPNDPELNTRLKQMRKLEKQRAPQDVQPKPPKHVQWAGFNVRNLDSFGKPVNDPKPFVMKPAGPSALKKQVKNAL